MELNQLQQRVDQWIHSVGVKYYSELTNLGILMEEVGELARIIVREYGEQSYKSPEHKKNANLEEEFADVLFVLTALANQTGINLEDAFKKKLLKKTKRDQERHKNNPKLNS